MSWVERGRVYALLASPISEAVTIDSSTQIDLILPVSVSVSVPSRAIDSNTTQNNGERENSYRKRCKKHS